MGAAIGGELRRVGHEVMWATEGRSDETVRRAEEAGLRKTTTVADVADACDVIISVCPPHAALDVAHSVAGFGGIFVDGNAVSPATARAVAATVRRCVDGGIVGAPPSAVSSTRLYLSGNEAAQIASLFVGTNVVARVVSGGIGAASAVKMTYAAWTKGTAALLLAIRDVALAERVDETLRQEWGESLPGLTERLERAERSARAKGWRWVGEMEEIAATFAAAGSPDGFHEAAAEVFRTYPRLRA
jgi:3-hydroxyisobutyrate dehydrogenase-like beta-hydroxyacid dehydrogenase